MMSCKRKASRGTTLDAAALEEYACPICMETQADPRELSACGHVFCSECITHHLASASDSACPVCRKPSGGPPVRAKDYDKRKKLKVPCECGEAIPLLQMREHSETCRAVAAAAERATAAAAAVAPPPNAPPAGPNRSTFSCPFCDATHLPRAAFLQHLNSKHGREAMRPAVCPICASMPWGDSSYRSANLLQHVQMRHQFDYDTTTSFGQSEEDVLAEVLRRSLEES